MVRGGCMVGAWWVHGGVHGGCVISALTFLTTCNSFEPFKEFSFNLI